MRLNTDNHKVYKIIIFLILSIFLTIIYSEIIAIYFPSLRVLSLLFKSPLHLICHQENMKLIHINGAMSLVCARCSGIYSGFWFMSLILLLTSIRFKIRNELIIISLIIMGIDVLLVNLKIFEYSHLISFLTGILLGSVLNIYFYLGLDNLIKEFKIRKEQ